MKSKIREKLFLLSFIGIISSLVLATLFPQERANEIFYHAPWFGFLWLVIAGALSIPTFKLFKKKKIGFALIHLGFILIVFAGFLSSLFLQEGFIEIKEGQSTEVFWVEDDLSKRLDFSISLKDFSVEFYPEQQKGILFVKKYKSAVVISQRGKAVKEGTIEVNKPLGYKGFYFYQYGYDPELPGQTLFQVVKDPGLPVAYAGYLFFLAGMIFSFKKIFFYV
ncbi:MAG: cytochrome c biogenesis protein ResB [Candidatus Scalindua sp.]